MMYASGSTGSLSSQFRLILDDATQGAAGDGLGSTTCSSLVTSSSSESVAFPPAFSSRISSFRRRTARRSVRTLLK